MPPQEESKMSYSHDRIRDWALGAYGEGGYRYVESVVADQMEDPQHTSDYWTREQEVGFSVGEVLKEHWEHEVEGSVGFTGPLVDVLKGAMSDVNWNQLGMEVSEEALALELAEREAEGVSEEELEAASEILAKLENEK